MNRKSSLLVLALLGIIVAAGFWFLSDSPVADEMQGSGSAQQSYRAPDSASPKATKIKMGMGLPFQAGHEGRLTIAEEERIEAPVANGLKLLVVDDETDEPVPLALVILMTEQHAQDLRKSIAHGMRIPAQFKAHVQRGRYFLTDSRGIARLPNRGLGPRGLVARKGRKQGVMPENQILRDNAKLRIGTGLSADVAILHADGSPAPGVPVSIKGGNGRRVIDRLVTDAEGRVQFHHLKSLWTYAGLSAPLIACVDLPLSPEVQQEINIKEVPTNTIQLRLPEMVRCTVRIKTAGGDPPLPGTQVALTRTDLWKRLSWPPLSAVFQPCDQHGIAEFSSIPVLHDWTLAVWHPGSPGKIIVRSHELGLRTVPEVIDVTWRPPFDHYQMRVFDQHGKPIRNGLLKFFDAQKPQAQQELMAAPISRENVVDLKRPRHLPAVSNLVVKLLSSQVPLEARLQLPPATAGISHLPDLRLQPVPILASGTVSDTNGAPIENATITISWATVGSDKATPQRTLHFEEVVRSNAAGQFAAHCSVDSNVRLRILCNRLDYQHAIKQDIAPGSRGIAFQLTATGTLKHKLNLPRGWHPIHFDLSLYAVSEAGVIGSPKSRALSSPDGDLWAVKWPMLPPGRYTFVARPRHFDAVLDPQAITKARGQVVIPNIMITKGANYDARLDAMDLTRMARNLTWEFPGLDPKQRHTAHFTVMGEHCKGQFSGVITKGRTRRHVPISATSVKIAIESYFPSTFPITGSHQIIRLSRPAEFKVAFSNVPGSTTEVQVVLKPLDPQSTINDRTIRIGRSEALPDWTSRAHLLPAGNYLISTGVIVTTQPDGNTLRRSINLDLPVTLSPTSDTPKIVHCQLP